MKKHTQKLRQIYGGAPLCLTESVGKHFQALNPLILMELQTINTVESVVLYQVERRVHRHLVESKVTSSPSEPPQLLLLSPVFQNHVRFLFVFYHCKAWKVVLIVAWFKKKQKTSAPLQQSARAAANPWSPDPTPSPSTRRVLLRPSRCAGSCSRRCCVAAGTELCRAGPGCSYASCRHGLKTRLTTAARGQRVTGSVYLLVRVLLLHHVCRNTCMPWEGKREQPQQVYGKKAAHWFRFRNSGSTEPCVLGWYHPCLTCIRRVSVSRRALHSSGGRGAAGLPHHGDTTRTGSSGLKAKGGGKIRRGGLGGILTLNWNNVCPLSR